MPFPGNPSATKRLIVALDLDDADEARALVRRIGAGASFYKIGYRLAFSGGLALARELRADGHDVFIDLKLLDIGNTVREGVASLAASRATCLTVHAYPHAMRAAQSACDAIGDGAPSILGVTVLTSLDGAGLCEAGYGTDPLSLVTRRAGQAAEAGIAGVVCSGREARAVREAAPGLAIVTPGIRPAGEAAGDQSRAVTPAAAIGEGADYLVVGRPITRAEDPERAARTIQDEIGQAL